MNTLQDIKDNKNILLYNAVIVLTLLLTNPSLPVILTGGLTLNLILKLKALHTSHYNAPGWARGLLTSSGLIVAIILIFYNLQAVLGVYGLIGYLLLNIITAAYLMYRSRHYMKKVFNDATKDLYGQSYDEWTEAKNGRSR